MKSYCNRTKDEFGNSCKTYIFDNGKRISFERYSLIKDMNFKTRCGGETIVKRGEDYILTFNSFSIDKDIIIEGFGKFEIKIDYNEYKKCTCERNKDVIFISPWCWKCNAFK